MLTHNSLMYASFGTFVTGISYSVETLMLLVGICIILGEHSLAH